MAIHRRNRARPEGRKIPANAYRKIRPHMLPGDVIAFGGKGGISDGIKFFTRSPVSHVGVVLRRRMVDASGIVVPGTFVEVIESTSLGGKIGVQVNRLSVHAEGYNGDLWWFPLSASARGRMKLGEFFDFLFHQVGKDYDFRQAVQAGLDALDWTGLTKADEDFGRFFCSELVAAALERGGVIPPINASEVTPIELVRWAIYGTPIQFRGVEKEIPGANSRELA